MSTRILLNAKGRRKPFLRAPDFNSADHPWAGFSFEETYSRNEPINGAAFSKTTIFLCTGGGGSAHRKHRGVWEHHRIEPGHVFIARRDVEIASAWTTNSWPTMVLQIDGSALQHIAAGQVERIEKSLVSAVTTKDERLAALMMMMREEVRAGCPSGKLLAESISLALLAYLGGRYAAFGSEKSARTGLSSAQMREIVDYIGSNLTRDVCVTDLASLVQTSPSHFARVFKLSFGVSPYRFIQQKRIEAAMRLLANSKLSSTQVALTYNFASQSHFAKVFRQFTGVTPKQYKAGL